MSSRGLERLAGAVAVGGASAACGRVVSVLVLDGSGYLGEGVGRYVDGVLGDGQLLGRFLRDGKTSFGCEGLLGG